MYQPPAATRRSKGGDAGGERGEGRASFGRRLRLIGWRRRSGLTRRADLQRVDPHRLGDVLQRHRAEIADLEIEPPLDLPVGVLGDADPSGLGDPLQARGDIDAVAHQIAVALLDHVAEMDADPKFDALVRRDPSVALDHRPLDFNGAVHRVDDAAELDNCAVAGALDDAAVVHGDGRIDQVAAKRPKPRQNPILVGAGKPRIADDVGHQDRGQFSGLAHGASAEARSPVAGGLGMAAFPCCTDETRRPGMQARRSVLSLAALARCVRQSNAENNSRFLWPCAISLGRPMRLGAAAQAQDDVSRSGRRNDTGEGKGRQRAALRGLCQARPLASNLPQHRLAPLVASLRRSAHACSSMARVSSDSARVRATHPGANMRAAFSSSAARTRPIVQPRRMQISRSLTPETRKATISPSRSVIEQAHAALAQVHAQAGRSRCNSSRHG